MVQINREWFVCRDSLAGYSLTRVGGVQLAAQEAEMGTESAVSESGERTVLRLCADGTLFRGLPGIASSMLQVAYFPPPYSPICSCSSTSSLLIEDQRIQLSLHSPPTPSSPTLRPAPPLSDSQPRKFPNANLVARNVRHLKRYMHMKNCVNGQSSAPQSPTPLVLPIPAPVNGLSKSSSTVSLPREPSCMPELLDDWVPVSIRLEDPAPREPFEHQFLVRIDGGAVQFRVPNQPHVLSLPVKATHVQWLDCHCQLFRGGDTPTSIDGESSQLNALRFFKCLRLTFASQVTTPFWPRKKFMIIFQIYRLLYDP
ncbi:hypothetical protein Ciccas_010849 [Cichlidogyrus casuarinus]|uniref:Uncharacterized protein n=1 Tax=Cichlidogyrus casuarinus TaxID=1844966 RepID=A0ABD2PSY6_9PLAT